jgi:hypothetical protein
MSDKSTRAEQPAPMGGMPKQPPLASDELFDTPAGAEIDVVVAFERVEANTAEARLLDPDSDEPFTRFTSTPDTITIGWDDDTKVVMGASTQLVAGAIVWVHGTLVDSGGLNAALFALMDDVATVAG